MDPEQTWKVIESERLSLGDLLADLTKEEWETPSLCEGWRVRDVAAHLTLVSQPPSPGSMLMDAVRVRGNFDRLNHDMSVRHADQPTARIVADLRSHAASRRMPVVTNYRNILFDLLVHGQDISIPLDRPLSMPPAAAAAGATRVWTMGWPFWAKRKLRGYRLTATDVDWSVGAGEEISGPIDKILLLLTGRTVALRSLRGDGAERLTRASRTHPQ